MLCRVSSDFIQRPASLLFLLLELGRCEPRDVLELGAEVGGARIVQLVGYFAQRQFAIGQQLFDPFDLLGDDVLLDSGARRLGEQFAQRAVIFADGVSQVVRQVGSEGAVCGMVHQGDDEILHLLYRLHSSIVYQFELQRFQLFFYALADVGRQLFSGDGNTQFYG